MAASISMAGGYPALGPRTCLLTGLHIRSRTAQMSAECGRSECYRRRDFRGYGVQRGTAADPPCCEVGQIATKDAVAIWRGHYHHALHAVLGRCSARFAVFVFSAIYPERPRRGA